MTGAVCVVAPSGLASLPFREVLTARGPRERSGPRRIYNLGLPRCASRRLSWVVAQPVRFWNRPGLTARLTPF